VVADAYPDEPFALPEFETPLRGIEKRNTLLGRKLNQLQRRQASLASCLLPCSSVIPALECSTGPCVCPILNSAGMNDTVTCANCLNGVDASESSYLTLLANVCAMCSSQCSGVLGAILQSQTSCSNTTCECSLFSQVGAESIGNCASCVKSFNPAGAATLLGIEQACGIGNASGLSSPPMSTPLITTTTLSQSGSTTPTTSHSAAHRFTPVMFWRGLFWVGILFEILALSFFQE
jgi:hypothetical protein